MPQGNPPSDPRVPDGINEMTAREKHLEGIIANEYSGELLALEEYPDDTAGVLAAMAFEDDEGDLNPRGDMPRKDIVDNLHPSVELNKDQVRYRLEQLANESPPLVKVDERTHREWGNTKYYTITEDGTHILAVQEMADELLEQTDPITQADVYQILEHLQRTRAEAERLEEALHSVMMHMEQLEQRLDRLE